MRNAIFKNQHRLVSYIEPHQWEVINGSLLGDACLHFNKREVWQRAKFSKVQSLCDKDNVNKITYMNYHVSVLFPFSCSLTETDVNYSFLTFVNDEFTILE